MPREVQQVLMSEKYQSGRMYRILPLLPTEVDKVSENAGKSAGASALAFRNAQVRMGIIRMVKGWTKDRVPFVPLPVIDPTTKEPKVDASGNVVLEPQLDTKYLADEANWVKAPGPVDFDMKYDEYIDNAKDDSALSQIWSSLHETSVPGVDRIMGKAQQVSSG